MYTNIYKKAIKLLFPLIKLYINKRKKKGKEDIDRFNERMGQAEISRPQGKLIWMHGASVGEALSMIPLIDKILADAPKSKIMITTGTITSAKIIASRITSNKVIHQYIPIDHPNIVSSFLNHWQPDLVLWFESEFWPSMVSEIGNRKIPLILLNGRISDKSFKNWGKFNGLIKEMLSNFTLCLGQTPTDAERLKILGAKKSASYGNLKYAASPLPFNQKELEAIRKSTGNRPLWLASSTHDNEEERITKIHKKLAKKHKNLLTIIVPRHPQRGPEILDNLQKTDSKLNIGLRSKGDKISKATNIYIADTIGELGLFYRLAKIVFIGGSLVPHGGQNPLEPARLEDTVIIGPYYHNFTDMINKAKKQKAILQTNTEDGLYKHIDKLLEDKKLVKEYSANALKFANTEAKVVDKINKIVKEYI